MVSLQIGNILNILTGIIRAIKLNAFDKTLKQAYFHFSHEISHRPPVPTMQVVI